MRIQFISILLFQLSSVLLCAEGRYLSPTRMALDTENGSVWVVLSSDASVVCYDLNNECEIVKIPLDYAPSSVSLSFDKKRLLVSEFATEGKLHLYTPDGGKKIGDVSVGAYPSDVCAAKSGNEVWVANRFGNSVSLVDVQKRKEIKRISVVREPKSLALSPDGRLLAVANFLPHQSALDTLVTSMITLIDTQKRTIVATIPLSNGSQSLEDVCFSADGRFVYATHVLSRFLFPTTQLERGWMNTNALSIVDVATQSHYCTLLLDNVDKGAANPCGLTIDEAGSLQIAVSGTHELITLKLQPMHAQLEQLRATTPVAFQELSNNLGFLSPFKQRILLKGKGPRYVISFKGKSYLTAYFSGALEKVSSTNPHSTTLLPLGNEPEMDDERKGELYFADAALCYQNWQSCVTCHPDARADALNWDLLNDGLGNPKNTKSMLLAHATPPNMITGIRDNAEIAVRAGIKHIQFANRPDADAACIDAYLKQLQVLPSPYLKDGKLSEKAQRGERLFQEAGCGACHSGPNFTDLKSYNVGVGVKEYSGFAFDTPSLREAWRTAPYLYDGRAATIKEVLTRFNEENAHGVTKSMTEQQIEELEEYVLSL